jgi:hypothetical protein
MGAREARSVVERIASTKPFRKAYLSAEEGAVIVQVWL